MLAWQSCINKPNQREFNLYGYQFDKFGLKQVINLFSNTKTMNEPDALYMFENLFKACTNGLLSNDAFDEALTIYKQLIAVRMKLDEIETTFPVSR